MKFNKFKRNLKNEFDNTFDKPKRGLNLDWFKKRYILYFIPVLLIAIFLGNHIYVGIYNRGIEKKYDEYVYKLTSNIGSSSELIKISNHNEIKKTLDIQGFERKESILDNLFSFGKVYDEIATNAPTAEAPNMSPSINNSYDTNAQTEGIDEADVSKCDGKYIYRYYENFLYVFDCSTGLLISSSDLVKDEYNYDVDNLKTGIESYIYEFEMYVYENNIILLSVNKTFIYKFIDNELILKNVINYNRLKDSRLMDNYLYLISINYYSKDTTFDNLYYDGYSDPNRVYNIIKYNLDDNTFISVDNLNSGSAQLYMSNNHVYLATSIYASCEITLVSIFDLNLNPLGAVKVMGYVNDQFSMDEYNGYFRIVHTNRAAEAERLNAISIYDLESLERVGYLDNGIGLERQTVKSARFENDTCYIVTYEDRDPLYEIDLSDPKNPKIVSIYKAPGYSNYLHTFEINNEEYLFGIGYMDNMDDRKISIYKNDSETTQIGKDFIISEYNYVDVSYQVDNINHQAFNSHKALFIYNDNNYLYLGLKATYNEYAIFKIDVNSLDVVTIHKTFKFTDIDNNSRCYLVNDKLYITNTNELFVADWN